MTYFQVPTRCTSAGQGKCLRRNDGATRATPEQPDKKTRMGHVFVPHFGEPCRSFILGNVSWYVDASGAALHVTWRVLDKRASEQNTVLIRQKNASPSSLRSCAARPILLSLPLSLFTIEEEPRERPHQHPREHGVRSDHSLAQLGLHAFRGSACVTRTALAEGPNGVGLEHARNEGQSSVARRERRHDLAGVRRDVQAPQRRDGARDLGLSQEGHDAKHRQAAVVDLRAQLLRLPLVRLVLLQVEGVEELERDGVRDLLLQGRERSGLATAHVVRLPRGCKDVVVLAPELEETDEEDDLQLRIRRESIPLVRRAAGGSNVVKGDLAGQLPREMGVGLHAVANERRHRDATVLDLRVAQEADRRLLALVPELPASEVQRVPVPDNRVELLRQGLEVVHRLHGRGRGTRTSSRAHGRNLEALGTLREERHHHREHLKLLRRREPVKQLPPALLLGSLCLQEQLAQPRQVDHLVRLVQHLLHLLHSAMRRLRLLLNLLQGELHEGRQLPHGLQLLLELRRVLKHRLHLRRVYHRAVLQGLLQLLRARRHSLHHAEHALIAPW